MTERVLLQLTIDAIFKAFFEKRKDLLISLVENFVPLPKGSVIEDVSLLNTELLPDKVPDEYKSFTLDLRVKLRRRIRGVLQNTEIVHVEVQTTSQKFFTDRILVYASRAYSGQIKKGEDFNQLLPVYSLVFTTANLKEFAGIKDYYHICNIRRTKPPEVIMSRGLCFVIVELGKFQSSLHELFDKKADWCYLLKNSGNMDFKGVYQFSKQGRYYGRGSKAFMDIIKR